MNSSSPLYVAFLAECSVIGANALLSREEKTVAIKKSLEDVVARGVKIPDRARQTKDGGYARHPLLVVPGAISVFSMVWAPGQKTPIHDHGNLWCVECVLEGEIEVTSFEGESAEQTSARNQGHCSFEYRTTERACVGDAGALIPPFDHHILACAGETKAITIHVYGGVMEFCAVFRLVNPPAPNGDVVCRREEVTLSQDSNVEGGDKAVTRIDGAVRWSAASAAPPHSWLVGPSTDVGRAGYVQVFSRIAAATAWSSAADVASSLAAAQAALPGGLSVVGASVALPTDAVASGVALAPKALLASLAPGFATLGAHFLIAVPPATACELPRIFGVHDGGATIVEAEAPIAMPGIAAKHFSQCCLLRCRAPTWVTASVSSESAATALAQRVRRAAEMLRQPGARYALPNGSLLTACRSVGAPCPTTPMSHVVSGEYGVLSDVPSASSVAQKTPEAKKKKKGKKGKKGKKKGGGGGGGKKSGSGTAAASATVETLEFTTFGGCAVVPLEPAMPLSADEGSAGGAVIVDDGLSSQLKSLLPLEVLCYVPLQDAVGTALASLTTRLVALLEQIAELTLALGESGSTGGGESVADALLMPVFFLPRGMAHVVTSIYPFRLTDLADLTPRATALYAAEKRSELVDAREVLKQQLQLSCDRLGAGDLRVAARVRFDAEELAKEDQSALLPGGFCPMRNVHLGLPLSGLVGGSVSLMEGACHYYHYMQGGYDDKGWGCAYRSLQTIISWLQLNGTIALEPVPTHKALQMVLRDMGIKPSSGAPTYVGSKEWIGSQEVGWILNQLHGVESKMVVLSSVSELMSKGQLIQHHFRTQGTPIMMGACARVCV